MECDLFECSGVSFIQLFSGGWRSCPSNLNNSLVYSPTEVKHIPVGSSKDGLSKVFWLRIDPNERWPVNDFSSPMYRAERSLPKSVFVDLRPNASTDLLAVNSKVVELLKSYRLV
jgi:hypothetical protein